MRLYQFCQVNYILLCIISAIMYTQAPITGRPVIETRKKGFTLYRPNSIFGLYYKFYIWLFFWPDIEFDSISGGRLSGLDCI